MKRSVLVVSTLIALACAKGADRPDTTAAKSDTAGMAGMSMPGMMSPATMDSMAAHLRAMDTASAGSMQAMLPMHRQMVANMLSQMNSDMRSMNMNADARWTALMDSVRQDLVLMPEMNAQQLKAFGSPHRGRLARLMESHRDMMKGMKMQ